MQGSVDLGAAVRRSPFPRLHIAVAIAINITDKYDDKKDGTHAVEYGSCQHPVVLHFGKLFTETNEQKFSLRGVHCQKTRSRPGRNMI